MTEKRVLGRGLEALIPRFGEVKDELLYINTNDIVVKTQLREAIDEKLQAELAQSIKEKGILQPVIVKKEAGRYILIAGYRRLYAAKLANLDKIPAIVRQIAAVEEKELALIENLQRKDLNPIEEAQAYKAIIELNDYTHEELAEKIGKDRSYITNMLRLLKLPDRIKEYIKENKLSLSHARALAAIDDEELINNIADKIIEKKLSVRAVEKIIKLKGKVTSYKIPKDAHKEEEDVLIEKLGTKVRILGQSKGKIIIIYYSEEDLKRLINLLT